MNATEYPTELERVTKAPNKVRLDSGAYKNVGILTAHFQIPKYRIYGYALEHAITNNWDDLKEYIETEEQKRKAIESLQQNIDLSQTQDIHLNWDDEIGGFRFVLKYPNTTNKTIGIVEKDGWDVTVTKDGS